MSDPIFYDTFDTMYHFVMDTMPQFLQDRPMASAFTLGSSVIYGSVRLLQLTSKYVVDYFIPNFDENWLPKLEKGCIAAMAAAPILYSFIDPEGAKEVMTQNPVYTSGILGILLGSIAGAAQDLFKRSKQTSLEERLPEQ